MKTAKKTATSSRRPAKAAAKASPKKSDRSRSRTPVKKAPTKKILQKQSTMDVTKKAAKQYLDKGEYIPTHSHRTRAASASKRKSKK